MQHVHPPWKSANTQPPDRGGTVSPNADQAWLASGCSIMPLHRRTGIQRGSKAAVIIALCLAIGLPGSAPPISAPAFARRVSDYRKWAGIQPRPRCLSHASTFGRPNKRHFVRQKARRSSVWIGLQRIVYPLVGAHWTSKPAGTCSAGRFWCVASVLLSLIICLSPS